VYCIGLFIISSLYHYFTLVVAIIISVCAAYYSIVGLTAIFASAAIPIIIMGASLELAKITGAVWLKLYWTQATWWLKLYLVPAVAVLMLITSMGIFGFLSKAHIEQTAVAQDGVAQIERIDTEIATLNNAITRGEAAIAKAEGSTGEADAAIQAKIDTETARVEGAAARAQPAIDEQNAIIAAAEAGVAQRVAGFEAELAAIDSKLASLESALGSGDVEAAQTVVGVKADGDLGPATQRAITAFREAETAKRAPLVAKIEEIRTAPNPAVDSARAEISRLRGLVEAEIADSNALINRLRSQLGQGDPAAVAAAVAAETAKIEAANTRIAALTEERYALEITARQLEAEVGPIKYVAEMIYGEADNTLLEKSVRWMILLLVLVFDPLAVILTLAAISGLTTMRPTPKTPNTVTVEKIVEVPVARVVEKVVEIPVEVPVEKIVEKIVEVPVEDTERVSELAAEVKELLDKVDKQTAIIKGMRQTVTPTPVVEAVADDFELESRGTASFGTTWPDHPAKGDLFLKVDIDPNKLYKWNGKKWIEIDRGRVDDTLVYDVEYIKWLVDEVKRGRREFDDLTDQEQAQIKAYIVNHGPTS